MRVVLPFKHGLEQLPPITEVRSTLLVSSFANVRARGWEARYTQQLGREMAGAIGQSYAGRWLPVELALSHYQALDELDLLPSDITAAGVSVADGVQKVLFSVVGSLAQLVGSTPWLAFEKTHRLWYRLFVGGDVRISEIDPRRAEIEIMAEPLIRSRFFRLALPEHFRKIALLLANTPATAGELGPPTRAGTATFVLRW